jgi:electron transfer flavoprotein alpha subunit
MAVITTPSSRPPPAHGKNIAPRVAALLDVMQISDILSVEGAKTFTRPIYAGNAIATVQSVGCQEGHHRARHRLCQGCAKGGRQRRSGFGPRRCRHSPASSAPKSPSCERPELTSAKIIVSGGRALKDAADVRSDHLPAGRQARRRRRRIARRGRCGLCPQRLSGRPDRQDRRPRSLYRGRHLGRDPAPCGHEGFSKTIIAINKDEDAPIFQVADIGLVGDLFNAVPELTGKL